MTYSDLPINQKINAKANRLVLYRSSYSVSPKRLADKLAGLFLPESLLLESPGIHNNRNYDGPRNVDYDKPDWMYPEVMARYQSIK